MGSLVSVCDGVDIASLQADLAHLCESRLGDGGPGAAGGRRRDVRGALAMEEEEACHAAPNPPLPALGGPQLALRVAFAPLQKSLGSERSPFDEGDEVAVVSLEKVRGWDALYWRQERVASEHSLLNGGGGAGGLGGAAVTPTWPAGPRLSTAMKIWGARIIASDGKGGFEEHWCLLQVAGAPEERGLETVKLAVQDARDVASYAHRFNVQTARAAGEDVLPDQVPGVKVAAPVACTVLGSTLPEIARTGEAVTLTPFSQPQVRKFLFEGSEDFEELPQAFFHYVAWASGGREIVADLQGLQEDDGSYLLVDPVVLRAAKPTIGDLLSVVAGSDLQSAGQGSGCTEERFNRWHPRCGELCKSFDPQRRSATHVRRHCGLSVPTCGVAGGGA